MFSVEHSSAGSILASDFPSFMSTSLERNTDRVFDKTVAARTCRVTAAGSILRSVVHQTTKGEAERNTGSL